MIFRFYCTEMKGSQRDRLVRADVALKQLADIDVVDHPRGVVVRSDLQR